VNVSPYLFISPDVYENEDGKKRVPIFDSFNARVLTVSEPLADSFRVGDLSPIDPAALHSFEEAGLVTQPAIDLRDDVYSNMDQAAADAKSPTFVLLPASYCNMGCDYCGQVHVRGGLSRNHRAAVLNRVIKRVESPQVERVKINWFGAEPLMGFATIRSMSQPLVEAADRANKPYHAMIVTNGVLLDHRKLAALVDECRITEYHITIDGPAAIHDSHRPLKAGGGSFERIVGFLSEIARDERYRHVNFVIRTNIDVKNSDYVSDYLKLMAERGFAGASNFEFNLAPVHPWGNDVSQLQIAMREYAEAEGKWLREMRQLGLAFRLIPSATMPRTCMATHRDSEVISSSGAIFSCTEYPLAPKHEQESVLIRVDELSPDKPRPEGEFDSWSEEVRAGQYPCATCWFLPACGGSCPKLWKEGVPACPSPKFNMNERLDIEMSSRGWRRLSRAAWT